MPRAPKKCGKHGCETRVTGRTYCDTHTTAWSGPRTASSLSHQTAEWKNARALVIATARRCALHISPRCTNRVDEIDMIISAADGGPIAAANMQPVCRPCHALKTRRER